MSHLLRIGDYVTVAPSNKSSGGIGWIKGVASDGSAIVEYVVQKKLSKDMVPSCISLSTLDTTGRSQSQDVASMPSLLSVNYAAARDFRKAMVDVSNTSKPPSRKRSLNTDELLKMKVDVAYAVLEKRQHDVGWLHRSESVLDSSTEQKKHLSEVEKNKVMAMRRYMNGVASLHKPTELLAKAWDIDPRTLRRYDNKGVDQSRKQRRDAGTNIFNNPKKQMQQINTYQVFKKIRRRNNSDGIIDRLTDADLKNEFDSLDAASKQRFESKYPGFLLFLCWNWPKKEPPPHPEFNIWNAEHSKRRNNEIYLFQEMAIIFLGKMH